jgi:hypothetical protein
MPEWYGADLGRVAVRWPNSSGAVRLPTRQLGLRWYLFPVEAKLDYVGRLVPKVLRDALGLRAGATVDISRYGSGLQLIPTGRTARWWTSRVFSLRPATPRSTTTWCSG